MGRVFLARDTKLERDVALKVLAPAFAGDAERIRRFHREARALASLNHQNIAQIYGVEESAAGPAIAMELVEGRSLRDIIRAGPVGWRRAVPLARQIAAALDAAHESGIIHRDLKPANVVVTPDGVAKVLDFGLAKVWADDRGTDQEARTQTTGTAAGLAIGTPAYMSPEQARGQAVDRRTDIWAFGCVLFELVAGRRAFEAPTVSDTVSAILEREPDWQWLPADTPPVVRHLIQRCLAKDRRHRLRDIGDALPVLSDPASEAGVGVPGGHTVAAPRWPRYAVMAAAFAAGAIVSSAIWIAGSGSRARSPEAGAPIQFALPPPNGVEYGSLVPRLEANTLAMAPDGSAIAFIGTRDRRAEVWIRPLAAEEAYPLAGTEGAVSAFWSPDARAVGFFAGGQLKRVDLTGGAPVKICDVARGVGLNGSWGATGDILFASVTGQGIYRVPAAGGDPRLAVPVSQGPVRRTLWPRFLPDGRHFVYTVLTDGTRGQVVLAKPDGASVLLVEAESLAEWVDPDWLLYVLEGTLVAQRVDLDRGRPIGEPVAVVGLVGHSAITGWSAFSSSLTGTLVAQSHLDVSRIAWFSRGGQELGVVGAQGAYNTLRLSPDASTVAFSRMRPELGTYDLWSTDIARSSETRLTSDPGTEVGETWTPDGRTLFFTAGQGGPPNLFLKDLASGVERRLQTSKLFQWPEDISPDGTIIAYRERSERGDWDLLTTPLASPDAPTPLFATPASEGLLRFSPTGGAVAYVSDASGRSQVYLSPFPVTASQPIPVSSTGGSAPRWRRDGRELYYISLARQLMAVPVDAAGVPGRPRPLFDHAGWTSYDVAPDGDRFIAVVPESSERDQPLTIIVGWPRLAGR